MRHSLSLASTPLGEHSDGEPGDYHAVTPSAIHQGPRALLLQIVRIRLRHLLGACYRIDAGLSVAPTIVRGKRFGPDGLRLRQPQQDQVLRRQHRR